MGGITQILCKDHATYVSCNMFLNYTQKGDM